MNALKIKLRDRQFLSAFCILAFVYFCGYAGGSDRVNSSKEDIEGLFGFFAIIGIFIYVATMFVLALGQYSDGDK